MAASKGDQPRKKDSMPPGVRGPGGPPPPPGSAGSGASSERPMMGAQSAAPSTGRKRFEELSFPLIRTLHGMPRWLIVVAPAILLFGGLILTGPLAWLGGILLFVVWLFIAWLTALSWPALTPGSRVFRVLVVAALLGIVVLKFMGRF
jgi:hypothetical protein